jgi:hypothetical protein
VATGVVACGLAAFGVALGLLVAGPWPAGAVLLVIELTAVALLAPTAIGDVASLGPRLLAGAVVRGDYARAASVKAETRELGAEIQARDRDAEEAIRLAREEIERERATLRETRPLHTVSSDGR